MVLSWSWELAQVGRRYKCILTCMHTYMQKYERTSAGTLGHIYSCLWSLTRTYYQSTVLKLDYSPMASGKISKFAFG